MHLKTLLAGLSLRSATADMETEITRISYDSRTTAPGDVFVAMTGFATDGHAYIGKAVAAGAAAVVCERPPEDSSVPYVLVENSRRALAVMAANYYGHPADSMTMVAVTGTNGKTTTTYLLKAILEQELGAKVGLIGTNQDLIGDEVVPTERTTPESLELQELFARMRSAGCTHVVMEASSHALALDRVYGIHYAVGIFTNLTQDHQGHPVPELRRGRLQRRRSLDRAAAAKRRMSAVLLCRARRGRPAGGAYHPCGGPHRLRCGDKG